MKKLGKHIVLFLNQHPEVYLPGMGIFRKERIPASFDEESQSFLAPSQRIVFSNDEKGSAQAFIDSFALAENSSSEESEAYIKKLLGAILLDLNEKGIAEIRGFGILKKEGDSLYFEQEQQEDSMALYKSVPEIKLIAPAKTEDVILEVADKAPTDDVVLPQEILDAPELEIEKKSSAWIWIVLLLIVAGAGIYWYLQSGQNQQPINPSEVTATIPVQEPVLSETLSAEDSTLALSDSLNRPTNSDAKGLGAENPEAIPHITFEIIVVSFGKQVDAEAYVETMKTRGHNFHVLQNRRAGNQVKVSYGSYPTEAEAQEVLNQVREGLAKEAWIYKKIHTK